MLSAKELKRYKWTGEILYDPFEKFLKYAQEIGQNYVFINKTDENIKLAENLKTLGYSVIIGYGDVARIKISW